MATSHTKKDDYENVNIINPFYLIINKADGYIEQNNESKYLVFISTDGNKKIYKICKTLGSKYTSY